DTFEKYERFGRMQLDTQLRQCPLCGVLCKPAERADGEVVAEMRCAACASQFCYYHSNAHSGKPCEEYRLQVAKEERLALEGVLKGTKQCPSCGIRTEKLSGCNHMTCSSCFKDWCWVCGHQVDSIAWHYNPGNPAGCQQFMTDSDAESGHRLMKCLRICSWPVMALSVLLFVLSGLSMVVWAPLCAVTWLLFFSWCTGVDPTFFLHASMALSFLPFICFQVVWLPVGALLNLLLVPCGAGEESLYFLMQIPFATVMSLLEAFGANQLHAEPGQGLVLEDEASDSEA
ncbi:unnamed protein product, partial [Polarella glacialis]